MRVYHRLIHIRDQVERPEQVPVPTDVTEHPVFKLVTQFRLHVQAKSAPITKKSKLSVGVEGMQIFGELARQLNEQGSAVMVYLVACILERLFGKDTIEDIESIKGDLTLSEIIDGISSHGHMDEGHIEDALQDEEHGVDEGDYDDQEYEEEEEHHFEEEPALAAPMPMKTSVSWPTSSAFSQAATQSSSIPPVSQSAFGNLKTTTINVFGGAVFGAPTGSSQPPSQSVFGNILARDNNSSNTPVFGKPFPLATAPPVQPSVDEPVPPNGNAAPSTSIFGKPFSLGAAPMLSTSASEPGGINGRSSSIPSSVFGGKSSSLATAPPLSDPANGSTAPIAFPPKAPTLLFSSNATTSQPNFSKIVCLRTWEL